MTAFQLVLALYVAVHLVADAGRLVDRVSLWILGPRHDFKGVEEWQRLKRASAPRWQRERG